jgi:hypothetical protein
VSQIVSSDVPVNLEDESYGMQSMTQDFEGPLEGKSNLTGTDMLRPGQLSRITTETTSTRSGFRKQSSQIKEFTRQKGKGRIDYVSQQQAFDRDITGSVEQQGPQATQDLTDRQSEVQDSANQLAEEQKSLSTQENTQKSIITDSSMLSPNSRKRKRRIYKGKGPIGIVNDDVNEFTTSISREDVDISETGSSISQLPAKRVHFTETVCLIYENKSIISLY